MIRNKRTRQKYNVLAQKTDSSCGQTCVAMLTGISHQQAIELYDQRVRPTLGWKRRVRKASNNYVSFYYELLSLFQLIDPEIFCKWEKFKSWENLLEKNCCAILQQIDSERKHWLVLVNSTTSEPKIIDPDGGRTIKLVNTEQGYKPTNHIIIFGYLLLKKKN